MFGLEKPSVSFDETNRGDRQFRIDRSEIDRSARPEPGTDEVGERGSLRVGRHDAQMSQDRVGHREHPHDQEGRT